MMHVYDASSLAVLRHAQAYSNLTYGQVVIDAAATRERRFAVEEIGSRVRVVSMAPSQHVARDGTTSSSMMCEVLGIGLLTVGEVLSKMPFMTVECAEDGCPLNGDRLLEEWEPLPAISYAALAASAAECEHLESVASYKGPLTRAAEADLREADAARGIDGCVSQLLELRGCSAPSEACRLLLAAFAATAHLRGEVRLEAMRLAGRGDAAAAVEAVAAALDEEARRRRAMKALAGLAAGGDA